MKITLGDIRAKSPCPGGWKKFKSYVKSNNIEQPFSPSLILESNGIADTLWTLQQVCGDDGLQICRVFAIDCALRSIGIFEKKHPNDKRPHQAIKATRQYLNDKITIDRLREKQRAASYAADTAASIAATAAAAAAVTAASYAATAAFHDAVAAAVAAADAAAADASSVADADASSVAFARHKEIDWQTEHFKKLIEGAS